MAFRLIRFTRFFSVSLFLLTVGCIPAVTEQALSEAEGAEEGEEKWYEKMNYGPYFTASLEVESGNIAYKGIAIRLDEGQGGVARGNTFVLFDTDLLRYAAGWKGPDFINWTNIAYDGSHTTHMSIVGDKIFTNPITPGWGNPDGSGFTDPRFLGLDQKPYGPLPRTWAHWKGLYLYNNKVVLSYTVGNTSILELPGLEQTEALTVFTRTLNIEESKEDLELQLFASDKGTPDILNPETLNRVNPAVGATNSVGVMSTREKGQLVIAACSGTTQGVTWLSGDSTIHLQIPASETPVRLKLWITSISRKGIKEFSTFVKNSPFPPELIPLTKGGPPRWDQVLNTKGQLDNGDGPFAGDIITLPIDNPWDSFLRLGGFDFFEDSRRAAICTWQGDVWIVDGLGESLEKLNWKRIATGMFQPLGLKIVNETIYITCRDQITVLRDLNGDGETDFYENFNNDAQVTEHFHEFAMALQTDAEGNFYYLKGGRHAKDALVPHHGTLIKVSKDGLKSEIIASGFRAPNGLIVNDDGTFITSDQEGHWTPQNRINLVKPGGFYGYMGSYAPGRNPNDFEQPICWIHGKVDRSPAEQVWVPGGMWDQLEGSLLSLSYGTGQVLPVLHEKIGDKIQGGVTRLPISEFPTGIHRGRFHPEDGNLYLCGLYGWSSNKTLPGGFYRIRYTGNPMNIPIKLLATEYGMIVTFSDPLDPETAGNPRSYSVERWKYRRTAEYGSDDYRISDGKKGHDKLYVTGVKVSRDHRSLFLQIPDMKPTMQMEINYNIQAADESWLSQQIHHTIHVLRDPESIEEMGFDGGLTPPPVLSEDQLIAESLQQGLAKTISAISPEREITQVDIRRSRLLSTYVPLQKTPSPFMNPGPFILTWNGYLQVEMTGDYIFYAEGNGRLTMEINGSEVLETNRAGLSNPNQSDPIRLNAGLNSLRAQLTPMPSRTWRGEKLKVSDTSMRISWSSDRFMREPIPPRVLRFDPVTAGIEQFDQLHLGRELFANRQCIKCHQHNWSDQFLSEGIPELSTDAPLFDNLGSRVNRDWLIEWLMNPRALRNDAMMPKMQNLTNNRQYATDVAAFLLTLKEENEEIEKGKITGDETRGKMLFEILGCLGCHAPPGDKASDNLDRVSLDYVKEKWQSDALTEFLLQPDLYYKHIRMPNFRLNENEVDDLTTYLLQSGTRKVTESGITQNPDETRGKELIASSGCLNCHTLETKKIENTFTAPDLLSLESSDLKSGCLSNTQSNIGKAPNFEFDERERKALQRFVKTDKISLSHRVLNNFALRQIEALRCNGCHNFDGNEDIWLKSIEFSSETSTLTEQNDGELNEEEDDWWDDEEVVDDKYASIKEMATLLGIERVSDNQDRPPLTWLGEKLKSEWMKDFISGKIETKPRPGLVARMPSFPMYSEEIAYGLTMDHGLSINPPPKTELNLESVKIGNQLTSSENGFDCVKCHGVGEKPAMGGSPLEQINFELTASRLREEYFYQWVYNPSRIMPKTMMPRFIGDDGISPLITYYEGDPTKQFGAIWQYIQSLVSPLSD